ncbi:hypothetical protein CA236_00175 [Sphingomonas sp. ABOLG]|uniref:plasmid recombination protein n=1 Tax=Sphingomonas sp. ABOLG TaxID=1985880 RepID=UPI000F7F34CC|nr:plasmid recombination protein [Sphingomonas sp. ABOLG]RSV20370.1 hypothetical protein CA236_00175 [Sphingomonas sp. ABOLG]
MVDNYGVVTFSDQGPVKTWSRLAAIASHNNREKPEPHCDPTAPRPIHLCGTTALVAEVKARLLDHKIDPFKLRKNAAIAFEVIMTASRPFFTAGPYQEAAKRTGLWIRAACSFARKMWGENRIVSMVLHLDEHTPHIHVVLLPLVEKTYRRWPERGTTWALEARSISGPGMYQKVHDAYAEAMTSLGLVRGKSRSRAKYRPYAAELADLDEQKRRAAEAAEAAEKAREEAETEAAKASTAMREQEQQRLLLKARADEILREKADLAREKAAVRKATLHLEVQRREAALMLAAAKKERDAAAVARHAAQKRAAVLGRSIEGLVTASEKAKALRSALLSVPLAELPPAGREIVQKVYGFQAAASAVTVPEVDEQALPAHLQQRFASLRGRGL